MEQGNSSQQRRRQLLDDVGALFDAADGFDSCAPLELRRFAQRSLGLQSWLASIDGRLAVAASRRPEASDTAAEHVTSAGGRRSTRDARAAADRGAACAAVPEIGEALAAGSVSTSHVDELVAAPKHLDESARELFAREGKHLAEEARFDTPAEFSRRCKELVATVTSGDSAVERQERLRSQRRVARWTDPEGMCHTRFSLDPLADAQIWAVFNQAIDAVRNSNNDRDRTFEQLRADAAVEAICRSLPGAGAGAGSGQPAAEVSVLIDFASLLGLANDGGVAISETSSGQPLPVATVRRLCCDGEIIPIVLGGDGVPLDEGRARRLATRAQRRALRAMYAACAHPECSVAFDECRIHHVTWWEKFNGRTDLDNLVPLCERHHHLVHEGGWLLTLQPNRWAVWTSPDGIAVYDGDSRNRVATGRATVSAETADGETARPGAPSRRGRQRAAHPAAAGTQGRGGTDDLPTLFGDADPPSRRGPPAA